MIGTSITRTRERFTEDYCLHHCEGYRVEREGRLLGYVEAVVVAPDEFLPGAGPVAALVVGLPAGVVIPVEDVRHVDAGRQLVVAAAR